MTLRLVVLVVLLTGQCSLAAHPLLAFLIDGFRYDYVNDLKALPGFRELVENGVMVDYMTPDFPSLSYPNYFSLMTGRNCDVHQMSGNYMWDEVSMKEFLSGSNPDSLLPLWWNGSEPIWVTLQKHGKNVSMYYWPGCEVEILGVRPSFCEKYVHNPSLENLTNCIEFGLNVLKSGEADLAAIYYENIDWTGHLHGPQSQQIITAVQQLDLAMKMLSKKLKEKNMTDQINIMLFSDHGMTEVAWMDNVIELEKYINMSDITKMVDRGPVVSLWPKQDMFEKVYTALSKVKHMRVYRKQEIPKRFHYKGGRFVSNLTLVAEHGWFITDNKTKLPFYDMTGPVSGLKIGAHGYDNEYIDMRGFFLATGPDFKRNVKAAPIRSVDVYNLMCRTMGVEPLTNNGSWSRVEYLLNVPNSSQRLSRPTILWICCMGLLEVLLALKE